MNKKLSRVSLIEKLATKSTHKEAVEQLITQYQMQTKNAVENIIQMSITVQSVQDRVVKGTLEEKDLDYFCVSVGLNKNSSSFRKMICIAKYAKKFTQYIDKLPSASSVLYEITTLDADKFEQLIENNTINPFITLNELKVVSNKRPEFVDTVIADEVVEIKIKFDMKNIRVTSLDLIADFYASICNQDDIQLSLPKDKLEKLLGSRQKQLKIAA